MVDLITKLSLVAGKNVILVVYNRLFKMMHFVATTEKTSAERLAKLFRDNMWKLHGLPKSMVSDMRLYFTAELTKELNKIVVVTTCWNGTCDMLTSAKLSVG